MESNFVDQVNLYAKSGNGGSGSRHFRREKFVPKGGPDGGDGGNGGSIIFRGNQQLWTLLHLRYVKHVKAKDGSGGEGNHKYGADADDRIVEVPVGTIIKNETGDTLAEIMHHDEKIVVLKGGKGGLGNSHFKTSVNQSPQYAQPGLPGIEEWLIVELKMLADVGLVGFPNAGKSTLLSTISAARPKIANYPFTTLVPNLGVVAHYDHQSYVMADIPGIIEGAAEGKGLGNRFLRHIERNSILLFMIPCDTKDILSEYKILLNELKKHNEELLVKQKIVAITKVDLLDEELITELKKEVATLSPIFISSINGVGIEELKDSVWKLLTADILA